MEKIDIYSFPKLYLKISRFVYNDLLTLNFPIQLVIVIASWFLARKLARQYDGLIRNWVAGRTDDDDPWVRRLGRLADDLMLPVFWVLLLWTANFIFEGFDQPRFLLSLLASLLNTWIIIHLLSSVVVNPFWGKMFAVFAWIIVALYVLDLLDPTITVLDAIRFKAGKADLSVYSIIQAILLTVAMLWLASGISRVTQSWLNRVTDLTPSMRILLGKIVKVVLVITAITFSLSAAGIDLTALAMFSGALGIGIGFGLQKVVSNFVSGIILLVDRSIRPQDVIEIGGTYGRVKSLGARYTSVITRDGTEFLIPNESLITQDVINWSYSDTNVRRKIPIGVSYDTDIELARELIIDAAKETKRVITYPEPVCHLIGFGDNSVDLQARFWISDPHNGVRNVQSEFLLKVWHKFKDNNIEIPFPQRDVNFKAEGPIDVRVSQMGKHIVKAGRKV